MQQWLSDHVVLLSVLSGLTFVAGLAGAVAVAVILPENYFETPPEHRHGKGLAKKVLKNVVGVVAVLAGMVMSLPLVPGPGIIILLVGVSMTDFPGKRKVEVNALRIPGILTGLNNLRQKFGRKPLRLPDDARRSQSPQPARGEPPDPRASHEVRSR
jgi:hypothetical protein